MMDDPEGFPGELINRLVDLVESGITAEGSWYELGWLLSFHVGGRQLSSVLPDIDKEDVPSTAGARQACQFVSRDRYFDLIRARLKELVRSGIEESFFVRALRDMLRRELEQLVETGRTDPKRAAIRDDFIRKAEDPSRIAAFRASLAADDPDAESLSDEEVAAEVRDAAAWISGTALGRSSDHRAVLAQWDDQVASGLSDTTIDEWLTRLVRRLA